MISYKLWCLNPCSHIHLINLLKTLHLSSNIILKGSISFQYKEFFYQHQAPFWKVICQKKQRIKTEYIPEHFAKACYMRYIGRYIYSGHLKYLFFTIKCNNSKKIKTFYCIILRPTANYFYLQSSSNYTIHPIEYHVTNTAWKLKNGGQDEINNRKVGFIRAMQINLEF